jgi:hypothetical protein
MTHFLAIPVAKQGLADIARYHKQRRRARVIRPEVQGHQFPDTNPPVQPQPEPPSPISPLQEVLRPP